MLVGVAANRSFEGVDRAMAGVVGRCCCCCASVDVNVNAAAAVAAGAAAGAEGWCGGDVVDGMIGDLMG